MADYETELLNQYRKERDNLDVLIKFLEARLGVKSTEDRSRPFVMPDEFFRMTISESIKKYLARVGRPARATTEIMDVLNKGGIAVSYNVVYTSLVRLREKGVLIRVGDDWGLEDWYPKPAPEDSVDLEETNA